MASNIYANQAFYPKVRYDPGAERQQTDTDVYGNEDAIELWSFQSRGLGAAGAAGAATHNPPVHRKSLRAAALGVAVLGLLLTAATVVLAVLYVSVALEKEQLQNKVTNRSQSDVTELQGERTGAACPEGWRSFGCRCYLTSSGRKSWSDSRTDCERRAAQLVIIDSREEQAFVSQLNLKASWIGLRTVQTSNMRSWKWLHSVPLESMAWASGQLNVPAAASFAACCDQHGKLIPSRLSDKEERPWVCEK